MNGINTDEEDQDVGFRFPPLTRTVCRKTLIILNGESPLNDPPPELTPGSVNTCIKRVVSVQIFSTLLLRSCLSAIGAGGLLGCTLLWPALAPLQFLAWAGWIISMGLRRWNARNAIGLGALFALAAAIPTLLVAELPWYLATALAVFSVIIVGFTSLVLRLLVRMRSFHGVLSIAFFLL
jgi:hypothetical protein